VRSCYFAIALSFVIPAALGAQTLELPTDTLRVSDRFFADSTTTGAVILAKFQTSLQRADFLRLEIPVDSIARRRFLFQDILVSIDLNGNGWVASWRIAGPRRIIDAYLARVIALAKDHSVIYDYGIWRAVVLCNCD